MGHYKSSEGFSYIGQFIKGKFNGKVNNLFYKFKGTIDRNRWNNI